MDREVSVIHCIVLSLFYIVIATSFGIALPSWIVSQESSIWVGVALASCDLAWDICARFNYFVLLLGPDNLCWCVYGCLANSCGE